VHSILFANYDVNSVNLGIVAHKDMIKSNPDLIKRFMRASTKAFEETQKNPEAAVDITLKMNPKSATREALLNGLRATLPLLHTPDTAKERPFKVSPKAMDETMNMLVEFGGVDKSAGPAASFYTNEFLPQGDQR
jgi:NitT/TauT family transport system substrate-binding protein